MRASKILYFTLLFFLTLSGIAVAANITVNATTNGSGGPPAGATFNISVDTGGRGGGFSQNNVAYGTTVDTGSFSGLVTITPNAVAGFNTPGSLSVSNSDATHTVDYVTSGGGSGIDITIGMVFIFNGGEVVTTASPTFQVTNTTLGFDSGVQNSGTVLNLQPNTTYDISFSAVTHATVPPETQFTTGESPVGLRFEYTVGTNSFTYQLVNLDPVSLPADAGFHISGTSDLGFPVSMENAGTSGTVVLPYGSYGVFADVPDAWRTFVSDPDFIGQSGQPDFQKYDFNFINFDIDVSSASIDYSFSAALSVLTGTLTNLEYSFDRIDLPYTARLDPASSGAGTSTPALDSIDVAKVGDTVIISTTPDGNSTFTGVRFETTDFSGIVVPTVNNVSLAADQVSFTMPAVVTGLSVYLEFTSKDNSIIFVPTTGGKVDGSSSNVTKNGTPGGNIGPTEAQPSEGYEFSHWENDADDSVFSTDNPLTTPTPMSQLTLNAIFQRESGTLNVNMVTNGAAGTSFDITGLAPDGTDAANQTSDFSQSVLTSDYTVTFSDAPADYMLQVTTTHSGGTQFTETNPSTGSVGSGETHTVTGEYVRDTGNLQVILNDNGSGATFDITGTKADATELMDQSAGINQAFNTSDYTVTFDQVQGYTLSVTTSASPGTQFTESDVSTGTINKDDSHVITATYTRDTGTLNINIDDAGSGATYAVSSAAADGFTSTGLTGDTTQVVNTAEYTVTIDAPYGYTPVVTTSSSAGTPFSETSPSTGTIDKDQIHTVNIAFTQFGELHVDLVPGDIGGTWRVFPFNEFHQGNSTIVGIEPGMHFIEASDVPGYLTPAPLEVEVETGKTTIVTLTYELLDPDKAILVVEGDGGGNASSIGGQWFIVEGPLEGSAPAQTLYDFGVSVVGLEPGDYIIGFTSVPGHITPANQRISLAAGTRTVFAAYYYRTFISAALDYDGDGIPDLAVHQADKRRLQVASGADAAASVAAEMILDKKIGGKNDILVPGDYDGDGIADPAFYRPVKGLWRVPGQFKLKNFGGQTHIPVPGDYDADGLTDPALYDPQPGDWTIWMSSTGEIVVVTLGSETEVPVPGRWDPKDPQRTLPAVYDVEKNRWTVTVWKERKETWKKSGKLSGKFGQKGDIPVPADYDGDGATDMAVYRPGENLWLISPDTTGVQLGQSGDLPVPAHWGGTDAAQPAIFRPGTGLWLSLDELLDQVFGSGGLPLVSGAR